VPIQDPYATGKVQTSLAVSCLADTKVMLCHNSAVLQFLTINVLCLDFVVLPSRVVCLQFW